MELRQLWRPHQPLVAPLCCGVAKNMSTGAMSHPANDDDKLELLNKYSAFLFSMVCSVRLSYMDIDL